MITIEPEKKLIIILCTIKRLVMKLLGDFLKIYCQTSRLLVIFNKIVFDVQVLDIETDLAGVVQKGKKISIF